MSKQATIASLIRIAAKSEPEFVSTTEALYEEGDPERIAEYFDRLNIPRSQAAAEGAIELPMVHISGTALTAEFTFEQEDKINAGVQRFLDRHERKIKWHAGHPAREGVSNVLLLCRYAIVATNFRLARLRKLLSTKDELSPTEWASARSAMNNAYLSFRNFVNLLTTDWADAMIDITDKETFQKIIGDFYALIDAQIQNLESHKDELEERRRELTVLPSGYPPVKPPVYFHGDLLGKGPWKLYWNNLNQRASTFRELVA